MGQPTDADRKALSNFIADSLSKIAKPYRDRLRAARENLPTAEELVRWFEPPITMTIRIGTEPVDVELHQARAELLRQLLARPFCECGNPGFAAECEYSCELGGPSSICNCCAGCRHACYLET